MEKNSEESQPTKNKKTKPINKNNPGRPNKSSIEYKPNEWPSEFTIEYVSYFGAFGEKGLLFEKSINKNVKQASTNDEIWENLEKIKNTEDEIQNKIKQFLSTKSSQAYDISTKLEKLFGTANKFKPTEILMVLEMLIKYIDDLCYEEFANFYFSVLEALCSPDQESQNLIDRFLENSFFFSFNYRDLIKNEILYKDEKWKKVQYQVKRSQRNVQKKERNSRKKKVNAETMEVLDISCMKVQKKERNSKKKKGNAETMVVLDISRMKEEFSKLFHKFKDIFTNFMKDQIKRETFFKEQLEKERELEKISNQFRNISWKPF